MISSTDSVVLEWRVFCPSSVGHLAMPGDIFDCLNWGVCATGIYHIEVKDIAEPPTMHRIALHNEELLCQKFQ